MPIRKNRNCELSLTKLNLNRSKLNGFRPILVYPGDGKYVGNWKNNERTGFGGKFQKNGLIYDGQWNNNVRNGQGAVRKLLPNGYALRIYIGQWKDDKKHGEGKKYYDNGTFYGWWKNDQRSGFGIMWYDNGAIYLGEWDEDKYNGAGVLFQSNGNRYEGLFLNGKKHGEGIYYHTSTGQIQKGMWEENICKTSIMFDEFRNQVIRPSQYPIEKNKLYMPDNLVHDLFRKYLPEIKVSVDDLRGLACLDLVKKIKNRFQNLKA